MSVNKQCLEQNIRRLPEEFSVQEFCDSFRDNYPVEFAKWVEFHIKKGAVDEQNAIHSTIHMLKFELSHRCDNFVEPLESGLWKKRSDSRF
jgi:hypothetical protein